MFLFKLPIQMLVCIFKCSYMTGSGIDFIIGNMHACVWAELERQPMLQCDARQANPVPSTGNTLPAMDI